jgi:hypothetical protein
LKYLRDLYFFSHIIPEGTVHLDSYLITNRFKSLERRDRLGGLVEDWMLILKCILKVWYVDLDEFGSEYVIVAGSGDHGNKLSVGG